MIEKRRATLVSALRWLCVVGVVVTPTIHSIGVRSSADDVTPHVVTSSANVAPIAA